MIIFFFFKREGKKQKTLFWETERRSEPYYFIFSLQIKRVCMQVFGLLSKFYTDAHKAIL